MTQPIIPAARSQPGTHARLKITEIISGWVSVSSFIFDSASFNGTGRRIAM